MKKIKSSSELIKKSAVKFRLKTSKKQKLLLFNHIFIHNQAWNILLNLKIEELERNKVLEENNLEPIYLTSKEQDDKVKQILKDRELSFNTKVIQQTRMNFNNEVISFFKKNKKKEDNKVGFLKFKSSKSFNNQGFQSTKEQYKIKDYINPKTNTISKRYKILRLFNQSFKIRWSKELKNIELKSITISYKDNRFYISFNIEEIIKLKTKKSKDFNKNKTIENLLKEKSFKVKSASIDININSIDLIYKTPGTKSKPKNKINHNKDFIYKKFSLKEIKDNNLFLNKSKKSLKIKNKLLKLERKQSRRIEKFKELRKKDKEVKLCKNFRKTQLKINRIRSKEVRKKQYSIYQIVNNIIKELKEQNINHLIVEDLNVKKMLKKDNIIKVLGKKKSKSMRKNIQLISFYEIIRILKYKCADNEIYFETINPKNTSKTCYKCNNIDKDLELKDRTYNCKNCSNIIDRDYNSCINIYYKSLIYKMLG